MRSFVALVVVFSLGTAPGRAAPPEADPEAAKALAARARASLDLRRPEAAARLFDQAQGRAPHPLWLSAAGEAWLEAVQPELAVSRLEAALADASLTGTAREHTAERLALAKRLAPLVAKARVDKAPADEVFVAWREAFAVSNLGRCLFEAARAAERARRFGDADALFVLAVERDDLSIEERRYAREALVRLRERDAFARRAPPPEPASEAGWAVVIAGSAVLAGGVVAWVVGEEQRGRVRSAMADDGELSSRMSRAEAQALERSANTWSTVGWVVAGVGVVAIGAGVVMLEVRPARQGAVMTARWSW
jgi:hypothetical protein